MEVYRQEGKKVPTKVSIDQLKELMEMSTISRRRKYFSFLFEIEMKKASRRRKKEEKLLRYEEGKQKVTDESDAEDGHIKYGLGNNTLFFRLYDRTINNFYHNRLIHAVQFSQKIVFDCGYDAHMTPQEAKNCAKQLMISFSENRIHADPFDVYFCNVNNNSLTMKALMKHIPSLYDEHFPLNITEKSYLDVFPKENIVYLTPHCREELTVYDHDAVYIVGAMVDKANQEPLSLAKAKKEKLKMAKLPLDRYLAWGSGSGKTLTLNQMILIMLDMRLTGDWEKALVHVPRRKLFNSDKEHARGLGRTISKLSDFRVVNVWLLCSYFATHYLLACIQVGSIIGTSSLWTVRPCFIARGHWETNCPPVELLQHAISCLARCGSVAVVSHMEIPSATSILADLNPGEGNAGSSGMEISIPLNIPTGAVLATVEGGNIQYTNPTTVAAPGHKHRHFRSHIAEQ
ncbi:hypothetical protein PR048_030132 [Dryococelus australis]|uniref:RNA (guanine-9-)-methyltransferase domain-containing protein 1 n=1 Tax=Dryococelus australis TaxID=614101 RepID=A0ABQ9G830_9NEOP|nr:hypothetical protein PR048_030132 [Dryococelus australis]